jgi:hypothetical protein
MLRLSEPYQTRHIRFIDLWSIEGWRMKAYGITGDKSLPAAALVEAAKRLAAERLPRDPDKTRVYGVGFIGIREGKTANFVFIDWWADENELHHQVHVSSSQRPAEFAQQSPLGAIACAWDLALIGFERDAWVEEILRQHSHPNIDQYLASRMNANV